MRTLLLILCAFVAGNISASAQLLVDYRLQEFAYDVAGARSPSITRDFQIASYDGSPFFADQWLNGTITWNSGKSQEYQMNLFILNDQFIIRQSVDADNRSNRSGLFAQNEVQHVQDSLMVIEFLPTIHSIVLGAHTFVKVDIDDTPTLVEQLYNANSGIWKRYTITIQKRRDGSGYTTETNPSFDRSTTLYYAVGDGSISAIPARRSRFYAIFDDKAEVVKKYVKDNRLKINREADIVKIFEYFDSL